MKRSIFLAIIALLCSNVWAQTDTLKLKQEELKTAEAELKAKQAQIASIKAEIVKYTPPKYWNSGASFDLNFNSLGLTNWAQGGVQSNSITTAANWYAKYKKGTTSWDNNADLAYGLIKNISEDFRKNEDKIDLRTKLGIGISSKTSYAALFNFRSQFAPGFDFSNPDADRKAISQFLAPATIQATLGFDYKPNEHWAFLFSPAALKMTIVNDDSIASRTNYIPRTVDANGQRLYDENFRSEFGLSVVALFSKTFKNNLEINSKLGLHNNVTDINKSNRGNTDVDWEVIAKLRVTKFIQISLNTHLLYDDDIKISIYDDAGTLIAEGPRIQFKRLLGVGFTYKIKS